MTAHGKAPSPRLKVRPRNAAVEAAALALGYTPIQARVLAGRISDLSRPLSSLVRPSAADLDAPDSLPDIDIAAGLLADAVENAAPIAIVTDHDADGATSHAIIRLSLKQWGVAPEQVSGYLSHRMTEGYGVSDAFIDRVLPQLRPGTCIITADQGSSDENRIARLRAAGHLVVVTDHHGIPEEGPPPSAHAVVNPVRQDSQFPDKAIAGCHTALLVMAATREQLVRRGLLPGTIPKVSDLLDFCAVGTIADASSLGQSRNNRLIVQRGLQLMNKRPRPCWNAMRQLLNKEGPWCSSDIAFQIATRINARGRLGDAMLGVEFLCADDEETAFEMVQELDANNRERRTIEGALTRQAIDIAHAAVDAGRIGLCLWLGESAHAGVHGITASRIVEKFGCPTICLSPAARDADLATGSIRTTEVVHVRDTLTLIQQRWPGLLVSAGGHGGAGGLKVRRCDIEALADAWDVCVRERYGQAVPEPTMLVDGDLEAPGLHHVIELAALEPYGRGFDPPVFVGTWRIVDLCPIGDQTHLKLKLSRDSHLAEGVWFNAKLADAPPPVTIGQIARLAFSLDAQTYRGTTRLQLVIRGIELNMEKNI
ncbi:MAG: single-stranded-DNA-specific exonuclease RecJ [Acidiferrobacterales bacterium]